MATIAEPNVVIDGLVFNLDAANSRCYSGSGITANSLVGGIGGTLVGGVGFTSTNQGSFVFDGNDDYINVTNGFTRYFKNNDFFTVCLWIRSISTNEPVLVSGGPNIGYYDLFLEVGDNQIYFAAGRGATTSYIQNVNVSGTLGYNLKAGYFYISFIKNSTSGSIFVNSINIPTTNVNLGLGTMPNIDENLRIGSFKQSGFNLNGNISQVQIYNRALTAQEILQNYNATKSRYGY